VAEARAEALHDEHAALLGTRTLRARSAVLRAPVLGPAARAVAVRRAGRPPTP
jgi:hypothetical protein